MAFSGALTLTDLNDFISPSQACIKPVEQLDKKPKEEYVGAKTEIVVDSTGSYYEVASDGVALNSTPSYLSNEDSSTSGTKLEQAQISLTDCLACSGCITSAESILITMQSHTEVFTFLDANRGACDDTKKAPVLSIAPQSLASLAAALTASASSSSSSSSVAPRVAPRQVLRRVQAFCKDILGFSQVLDITFARHLALQEHIQEFEERKALDGLGGGQAQGQLPMLASACPGWICYAEKAHSEMLPFISRTKSPQQIMGTLVKEWMGKYRGVTPDKVYHVSVMPCYDKKLEASRQDFYNDIYSTRDVDCVITTGELEMMMKEKGWDLSESVPGELEPAMPSTGADSDIPRLPELVQHPGSSSGSYLMSIIEHLKQTSHVPLVLSSKVMRNVDYEEFTLVEQPTGKTVFKGAKCYGFRNLQNVVRKVGRERGVRVGGGAAGKLAGRAGAGVGRRLKKTNGSNEDSGKDRQYDYVEVMACPGGCVNGGGQLKPVLLSAPPTENIDEEGYSRNWEQNGVIVPDAERSLSGGEPSQSGGGVVMNAKWGDKDWTRRVEAAYWLDSDEGGGRCSGSAIDMDEGVELPHDHDKQAAVLAAAPGGISTRQVIVVSGDGGGKGESTKKGVEVDVDRVDGASDGPRSTEQERSVEWADELAVRVLNELCGDSDDAVKSRHRFFRTEYHAVANEVEGLAVKW